MLNVALSIEEAAFLLTASFILLIKPVFVDSVEESLPQGFSGAVARIK